MPGNPHIHVGQAGAPVLRIIAWELTRACPLKCKHCRASAGTASSSELTTGECHPLMDNIASFSKPLLILTGGEPLLRPDIFDIALKAQSLGLPTVLATCGSTLTPQIASRLRECGVHRLSFSLDGSTAAAHDAFRGVSGAFDACLRGIAAAKEGGLSFQINSTISRVNASELPALLNLAVALGASTFNPFLLVPTGRGAALAPDQLSAKEYEQTLHWFADQRGRTDIQLRVTCAPHYYRILHQRGGVRTADHRMPTGCLGGKNFAFISNEGKVQICGFLDIECGDVRRTNLDFREIWEHSPVFAQVRETDSYHGRCGRCEFNKLCGGCRARAKTVNGDFLGEEPFCAYQPKPRTDYPDLDDADRRILSRTQSKFPIAHRPFEVLSAQFGVTEDNLIEHITALRAKGLIRRFGAIFDPESLGYTSTLVAAKVPAERLDAVAETVNRLPGVTHNYQRNHAYNLWFTLTAESPDAIADVVDSLRHDARISDIRNLPAIEVFKREAIFQFDGEPSPSSGVPTAAKRVNPTEREKELVRALQGDLPLVREPFAQIALQAGMTETEVLQRVEEWIRARVIRRCGAVVAHRRAGFTANGMVVLHVAEERIAEAGRQLASHGEVTHCYRRPPLPGTQHNVFAMVHGKSVEEVCDFVARVARELGVAEYDILFSTKEYKKTSMEFFPKVSESGHATAIE